MKKCTKCGVVKEIGSFYIDRAKKDGHQCHCIDCDKKKTSDYWYKNADRLRALGREYHQKRKEALNALSALYHRTKWKDGGMKSSVEHEAWRYYRKRKDNPTICSICKKETKLNMHHEDYSRPLDVTWCCPVCHKQIHLGRIKVCTEGG